MVTQEQVLTEIRAHPEGITTPELAKIFCARDPRTSYYSVRANVNARCRTLEKFDKVFHEMIPNGALYISKWFLTEAPE